MALTDAVINKNDKRHNSDPIDDDVAIDEIDFYIAEYTKRVTNFAVKKKINERFTFVSLVIV